ncbi:MAG TPA: hypothetical protein VEA59_04370 [Patescibacteria group bacterium]|nr:hypothetical protein [Patescibacteria group bacterium]
MRKADKLRNLILDSSADNGKVYRALNIYLYDSNGTHPLTDEELTAEMDELHTLIATKRQKVCDRMTRDIAWQHTFCCGIISLSMFVKLVWERLQDLLRPNRTW